MTQENTAAEAMFGPPIGITNPPIDELLGKASSKYTLAIFAARRARQINDYYQQIDEGMLEYVGPPVTPGITGKPPSTALREINAGLLDHTEGQSISLRRDICMHTAGNADISECLKVVVGITNGIATYKIVHVVRGFKELGHDIRVVPAESALNLVDTATFKALSGNPVSTTVFDVVDEVQHVRVGQEADLVVIVPAAADFMARAAHGRADDLLTAILLVVTCPVVLAPTMHTKMWDHPVTRESVETLRRRDTIVLDPAHGRLTSKDTGPGRPSEPEQIVSLALTAVKNPRHFRQGFEGVHFVTTAGDTRKATDPIRFIGSHSSGRQGYILAEMTVQRGTQVTVVAGHTDQLATPLGATIVRIDSTLEMAETTHEHVRLADVYIFAAAVADFRLASAAGFKMKKGIVDDALNNIQLVEDPDILATTMQRHQAGETPTTITMMGFIAETGDEVTTPLKFAKQKIVREGCDLLMYNNVSGGQTFDTTDNVGWLLSLDGEQQDVPRGSRFSVIGSTLDAVSELRQEPQPTEQPMPTMATEPLGP